MASSKVDARHEHRIMMEIVVDTYTDEECAMGWYCVSGSAGPFPDAEFSKA
jgi:hypothetical protein